MAIKPNRCAEAPTSVPPELSVSHASPMGMKSNDGTSIRSAGRSRAKSAQVERASPASRMPATWTHATAALLRPSMEMPYRLAAATGALIQSTPRPRSPHA
eukprot:CAMPEP_0183360490 /NCGR_PEP_ID=MMETSP0164_2-20130417/55311_1 /TAXON_ID=221442 /ORGANISM="Coccolithus pelagicus ssp braarudi, Strain PLY182g" /LENGTH=100 /DNA_ID=CAMNT_0025534861 /DNA_START=105 /DNA_END=404 /DNA_ORIENTATION=-